MQIVVVGDGKVGSALAQQLSGEGHEIVVIDNNAAVLRASQESLDVAILTGNGVDVEVQKEAKVPESDILIAATSRDEVNLLCCMVARKLGCKHTIARVRNPAYDQHLRLLKEELGLSLSINPEKATAHEVFRLLQFPSFLKRDTFAKGRVEVVELKLKPGNILANHKLSELNALGLAKLGVLICAVDRGGKVSIPSGNFTLLEGDKITIASDAADLVRLLKLMGINSRESQSVMIVGGGRISEYLTTMLIKARVKVTIIEKNRARCDELSDVLHGALIIHGDGTRQELLMAEGLADTDALVTLTGMDEENLIISMFGNYMRVPKTITKINRTEYTAVFSDKGIDSIVSPKLLTSDEIVRYVRAIGNTSDGSVITLSRIAEGQAEAVEFFLSADAPYLNIPLHQLQLRPNTLIACIIRAKKVIIPSGNDHMQLRDSIIVVVPAESAVSDLSDIFLD